RDFASVAAEFLGARPSSARVGLWQAVFAADFARLLWQHVALVLGSLLAAIAVGVPLGILAARRRGVAQPVLLAAGLVQTIPSLALLVALIPLLGIGAWPALAALFLYGLLPVVRNTEAGLSGIAPELRESALALGLPPGARLRLVELPLASPSILAGVQTAAVINVGTATLGALVGAGGYGQPILAGIRLADPALILEGAVPAALLALAVQGGFSLLGRLVVPPGLRLPPPRG
ncbi:MAG TPA: ABC transporter permease, partial [Anaeromyxobacteraceae bacterium]|nr:ABC transporter permease [Anaeromyxobacteraceae bacterium]